MSFLTNVLVYVIPTEVEESLTISVLDPLVSTEIFRDVSRSTRSARSGQALNMAAAPLLNGCNVTLPLDMTKRSVQQKSFAPHSGRKTLQMIRFRCLRRRRCVDVDVRLALRLCRRRRIHNRGVAFLFLGRRVRYGCFLLLTSRQKRGPHQEADIFVHVSIGRIRWLII